MGAKANVSRRSSIITVFGFLLAISLFILPSAARANGVDLCNWWGSNFSFDTTLRG